MISAIDGFDIEMVRRYIQRHGLDPVAEDSHAVKVDPARVTVERYGWGRVFFAENKGHGLSLTWIEHGDQAPTLPSWARKVRALVDRPECLGHREADHVCDGGENPKTGAVERPCAWRDRCMHVQRLAKKPGGVAKILEGFTDEDLTRAVEETRKPTRRKVDPEKKREHARRSRATYADSVAFVKAFVDRVMELGGWELATTRYRASVGQFFVREHNSDNGTVAGGNYFVMHRRVRDRFPDGSEPVPGAGRMPSIVLMYPHSSEVRFSMQIRSAQLEYIRGVMPEELQVRAGMYDKSHGAIVSVNRIMAEEFEAVASGLVRVIQDVKYGAPGSFPAIGTQAPRAWTQWSIVKGKR